MPFFNDFFLFKLVFCFFFSNFFVGLSVGRKICVTFSPTRCFLPLKQYELIFEKISKLAFSSDSQDGAHTSFFKHSKHSIRSSIFDFGRKSSC